MEVREPEIPGDIPVPTPVPEPIHHVALSSWLSARKILMWDQPVPKEVVLRALVESANDGMIGDPDMVLIELLKREQESSTFINEGVAFPHVLLEGLAAPVIALGISKQGVSDAPTEQPVRLVFLILSPKAEPDVQVRLLGLLSRAARNRHLFQDLVAATNGDQALAAIRSWETLDDHAGRK